MASVDIYSKKSDQDIDVDTHLYKESRPVRITHDEISIICLFQCLKFKTLVNAIVQKYTDQTSVDCRSECSVSFRRMA